MRVFKRDGYWWIDFTFQGKRHRKKISKKKREAEKALASIHTRIIEGKYLEIKRNEKIKFEELTQTYLNKYSRINKKSFRRDITSIKNLNTYFKGKYIYEIKGIDIENYKTKRINEGVKCSTINRELGCLRAMLNKAVEWGLLKTIPPKIKLFKENNQIVRYLKPEEAKKLIDLAPEPLKSIIIIAQV
ncbi:MAG TPA: hypothetical protein PKV21_07060 [bacterium]|nr:hypothetical protein [bacterium]